MLHDSSRTLTHLNLCHGQSAATQWKTAMSQCHLPVLQHFSVHDTSLPMDVLTAFLLSNPSISSAEIHMSYQGKFGPGSGLEISPEDRPRFLPRVRKLTGTTDFLLALFTPASGTDLDIPLFNLEHLHIVKDSPHLAGVIIHNDVTEVLSHIPALNKSSNKALIALRNITLELPYSRFTTGLWLATGAPELRGYATAISITNSTRGIEGMAASLLRAASDFISPAPSRRLDLADALVSLGHISTLKLVIDDGNWVGSGVPPRYGLPPYMVAGFISGFPGARDVVLEGVFGRPRDAVADAEEFWGGLGRIWDTCGKLQRLEINGIGGSETPAVWNRGEDEPTPGFTAWAPAFAL